MINVKTLHPNFKCKAYDNYDYCLARWEDDGGGIMNANSTENTPTR